MAFRVFGHMGTANMVAFPASFNNQKAKSN